jgi:hypothetical protein
MAMSKLYKINLDIGHFTAAGVDPGEFIDRHHADITKLHIKDRKRNDGENMPLGQGDTNIAGVLHQLRDKRYDIPAFLEYEYRGSGSPEAELSGGARIREEDPGKLGRGIGGSLIENFPLPIQGALAHRSCAFIVLRFSTQQERPTPLSRSRLAKRGLAVLICWLDA